MLKRNKLRWNLQTIYYAGGPCGTGKSYAACEYISRNLMQSNYLYVVPSLILVDEINQMLSGFGIKATVITSNTHRSVKSAIIKHMNGIKDDFGKVLLITWQAYVDLPYYNRRLDWQVIVDEVPQLDRYYPLALPRHLNYRPACTLSPRRKWMSSIRAARGPLSTSIACLRIMIPSVVDEHVWATEHGCRSRDPPIDVALLRRISGFIEALLHVRARHRGLHGVQGCNRSAHPRHGDQPRPPRHPRQLHQPRLDRD